MWMAGWARSERTFAVDAGGWGALWSLSSAPYFLAGCTELTLTTLCAWESDPSKLTVNRSVCATALYLADEGSGVVAEFTSRNHAWAVSPGA